MFNWYVLIKEYYKAGLYIEANLGVFVASGWITQEQSEEIKTAKAV